jgi:hypothetical protein
MADIIGVGVTPTLDVIDSCVICNRPGGQSDPSVSFNGENYFVTWTDPGYDKAHAGIKLARVTPQWTVLDTGYYISPGCLSDITCDSLHSFVVWDQEFDGVYGGFVDSSGQLVDTVIRIDTTLATSTVPRVVFATDNYLVVWADFHAPSTDLDIYGQLVSTEGQLIGNRIHIADGTEIQNSPDVDFDGTNYIVVWTASSTDIMGRLVATDGSCVGNKFRISRDTALTRDFVTVSTGLENYCVVWEEWHDDFDIYGNVDITIDIEETESKINVKFIPTIISGPLHIPAHENFKIFDISGRNVDPHALKPGIYFIEIKGRGIQKVVKIK